jgi:hypothetical protein
MITERKHLCMFEDEPLKKEEKSIVAYLKQHPRSTFREIYQALEMDHPRGYYYLTRLLAREMIISDSFIKDKKSVTLYRPFCERVHF